MALLLVRGQSVHESAGPAWHLVGIVKRDKFNPFRLTFSRRPDILSARIKTVGHALLPAVQLTDLSGKSLLLTNAQIIGPSTPRHNSPGQGSGHSKSNNTHELEEFSFVFSKITVENVTGSTSATDDWNSHNS
jgi:hypothetical protein